MCKCLPPSYLFSFDGLDSEYNWKWGLTAHCSKANEEARWVEKGKAALFWMRAMGRGLVGCPSKGQFPPTSTPTPALTIREQEFFFIGWRWGLQAETAQSVLIVLLKLVISGLTSVVLIAINLQFQGRFVPISLRPIFGIVAAYVMATVSHHVGNFFHMVGASVSIRQLTGYGSEYSL